MASEVVPCVFLAAPHPQRHVTPSATEEILCGGPHKISQIRQALLLGVAYNLYRLRRPPDTEEVNKAALTPFRMNTYEKQGEGGLLLLTRNPRKARGLRPGGSREGPVVGNVYEVYQVRPTGVDRRFRPWRKGALCLQSPTRPDIVGVTNHPSLLTFNFELSTFNPFSGPIRSIDADVLRREVAGPVAGHGFARVQVHNQRNVFGKKPVAGGAFVEIERLAAPQDGNARHLDVHARRVKRNARTPGGRENAAPVGVAAGEGGFHQRRSGDRFRDAARGGFILRVAHFDFDDALRAFAVSDDLQRERAANFFKRGSEGSMRGRPRFDRRRACFAVGENEQSVVRRSVAIDTDRIERASGDVQQRFLQKRRSNRRIRGHKREHRRHVGMDHPRTFGAAHQMNSLACHHERSGRGFWARVRGADRER